MKPAKPGVMAAVGIVVALAIGGILLVSSRPARVEKPAAHKPDEKQAQPAPEPADNSYCYVCHVNYEDEELATAHEKVGVGCETCHGESEPHSSDEDGLTPPDIMFPKPAVNAACMKCHPKLAENDEHTALLAGKSEQKHCTDCHGQHRLEVRTRIWDKKTGKLISDDGVRMMYDKSPANAPTTKKANP